MTGLLERDVLVINQKPKLIEMTNEYRIRDENGAEIGAVREEGQSKAKKALRLFTKVDQFLTHRLAVYDADGSKVLELVRPAKILKSTVQVLDPGGVERGRIVQSNVIGKKHFVLQGPAGEPLGSIDGTSWTSWNFVISDAAGTEVAQINKEWAGILREGFTTADHYVVRITGAPSHELRWLVLAAGAGIDTALKQDDTGGIGFGGFDL